jgi:hypothetical protein
VIEREEHATGVMQALAAHLLEVIDRHWTRTVRAEQQVDAADCNLSRANRGLCVRG